MTRSRSGRRANRVVVGWAVGIEAGTAMLLSVALEMRDPREALGWYPFTVMFIVWMTAMFTGAGVGAYFVCREITLQRSRRGLRTNRVRIALIFGLTSTFLGLLYPLAGSFLTMSFSPSAMLEFLIPPATGLLWILVFWRNVSPSAALPRV